MTLQKIVISSYHHPFVNFQSCKIIKSLLYAAVLSPITVLYCSVLHPTAKAHTLCVNSNIAPELQRCTQQKNYFKSKKELEDKMSKVPLFEACQPHVSALGTFSQRVLTDTSSPASTGIHRSEGPGQ